MTDPITELDPRYSDPTVAPIDWHWARQLLHDAEIYWITTVSPDSRPHVTPLIGVWQDEALHFCTGPTERKAHNLRTHPGVALTTGNNSLAEGFDVVLEGDAARVDDAGVLTRLAGEYVSKYGPQWRFRVTEDGFVGGGGPATVFRVAPVTVYGFSRGPFCHTRWSFPAPRPVDSVGGVAGD